MSGPEDFGRILSGSDSTRYLNPMSPASTGAEQSKPAGVAGALPHAEAKNGDIEVLRAVAILYTLIAHWVWGFFGRIGPIGQAIQDSTTFWTGVDLFFCISGFVIADSLMRSPAGGNGWKDFCRLVIPFWIRRWPGRLRVR